ncbi:MAG: hypothetical protein IKK20_03770, partial [Clostridia bacterium]|nr:hypothetical protein [Clostridia bacterium]
MLLALDFFDKICYHTPMKKLYYITTYGCQLNVHESEKLAGVLEGLGFTCATSLEEADVIVFNTCAIRAG